MGTRGDWATAFLSALGNSAPDVKTVNLVAAWTKGENTEARYNPLATTLDYGSNTKFNNCCGGNGVKNYVTRQQGIEASVITLRGSHTGYADIIKGLVNNKPEDALSAMKLSPWGTNFTQVEYTWRGSDVRNETLLSEAGGRGSNPEPILPETSRPNPLGPEGSTNAPGGYSGIVVPVQSGVTGDSVKRVLKIALGALVAISGIVLTIMAASKTDAAKTAVNIAKVAAL